MHAKRENNPHETIKYHCTIRTKQDESFPSSRYLYCNFAVRIPWFTIYVSHYNHRLNRELIEWCHKPICISNTVCVPVPVHGTFEMTVARIHQCLQLQQQQQRYIRHETDRPILFLLHCISSRRRHSCNSRKLMIKFKVWTGQVDIGNYRGLLCHA